MKMDKIITIALRDDKDGKEKYRKLDEVKLEDIVNPNADAIHIPGSMIESIDIKPDKSENE